MSKLQENLHISTDKTHCDKITGHKNNIQNSIVLMYWENIISRNSTGKLMLSGNIFADTRDLHVEYYKIF
jgi:hypothetical protein